MKDLISHNKWLVGILLGSFLLSVGYAFYFKIKPQVDARAYDVIAQNIVNGNGYREVLNTDIKNDGVIVRAGPIYEYFLAGVYKIFGHNYPAVWVLQAILHATSAFLIYLTCLLIFADAEKKKKIALLGAAILGFYPDLVEISAMLMTETLYIFFTCLFVYLFFLYVKNNRLSTLVVFAFVFGLATLTRPTIAFLIPVALFYLFEKKQFSRMLILGALLTVILAPWAIRNYNVYGKLMPFGAGGAYNFWIGNHVGANGEQEPGSELMNFFENHTVLDSYNKSMDQFKSFVLNSPAEFSKLTLLRANKYFSVLRPMGFWFYSSGWRQALFVFSSAIFSLFVLILSFGGIIHSIKFKEKTLYYLLAFTVITPLILFISVVETRYRFQIYPFLAIFAAYFIETFENNKKIWFKILLIAVAIILVNGLIDGLINFETFKTKIISRF